jgi:hypothetical protein
VSGFSSVDSWLEFVDITAAAKNSLKNIGGSFLSEIGLTNLENNKQGPFNHFYAW